jgi:cell division septation protein DedD
LTSHAQDEGFHEIQLNGKQLVFLFMAATVVSVVIFLCGVLVGRGVRAERAGAGADGASVSAIGPADPLPPSSSQPVAAPPAGSDPTVAPPPPPIDDVSYFNRLEKPTQPVEELKPAAPRPASVRAPRSAPSPAPEAAPAPAAPAPEPGVQSFAIQVAALRDRKDADEIAARLSSKGYAAYVLAPAGNTPAVYRVRVGQFKTRREAEPVATRLKKEEQFNPWITK